MKTRKKQTNTRLGASVPPADLPRGGTQPYRRPTRPGVNPTPSAVTAALDGPHDLGEAGRALEKAFPQWSEVERLDALREQQRNLQIRWLGSPERKTREELARCNGVPF